MVVAERKSCDYKTEIMKKTTAKAPYIGIELSPEEIALMKRVKAAFDPNGILNPGKIFPG